MIHSYNSDANFAALGELRERTGSFHTSIIKAFFLADGGNRATLVAAFPWLHVGGGDGKLLGEHSPLVLFERSVDNPL
jgi:hypothetical protein